MNEGEAEELEAPAERIARSIRRFLTTERGRKIGILICLLALILLAGWFRALNIPPQIVDPDTYNHLMMAEQLLENGKIPDIWIYAYYPRGRNMRRSYLPAMAYVQAGFYQIARALGYDGDLHSFVNVLPAILAALAVVPWFLFTRKIFPDWLALVATALVVFAPASMERVIVGTCDKESFFFVQLPLWLFLTLDSIEKRSVSRSILAGLVLASMWLNWGGTKLYTTILALSFIIYSLIGRVTPAEHALISLNVGLGAIVAPLVWPAGIKGTHDPATWILVGYCFLFIVYDYASGRLEKKELRRYATIGLVSVMIIVALASYLSPSLLKGTYSTFRGAYREFVFGEKGLVRETVAESQPARFINDMEVGIRRITRGDAFRDVGILWILAILALPLILLRFLSRRDLVHSLILVWIMLTIVAYHREIRLAYSFAQGAALATAGFFDGLLALLDKRIESARISLEKLSGKKKATARAIQARIERLELSKMASIGVLILIAVFTMKQAYAVGVGMSRAQITPWAEALTWIRDNTPNPCIVISWWDYGFWIQYYAKRYTILDGSNVDTRPNVDVAKMFCSPESYAPLVISKYNPENLPVYVLVSVEEFPKSWAINHIAGRPDNDPIIQLAGNATHRFWVPNPKLLRIRNNTVEAPLLIKMLPFPPPIGSGHGLRYFRLIYTNGYVYIYEYNPSGFNQTRSS